MDEKQIEGMAKWSAAREVQTKYGPKMFRSAAVTPAFSEAWKTQKEAVKALGAGFGKDRNGEWTLTWWQPLSEATVAARVESVAASRATSADIALPKPDGLDYLPFQKAGIRFSLMHKNVLIGDDMGLGKTIQAIGIINSDPEIKTAIVICPKSLKLNWLKELRKWLVRDLSVGVVDKTWPKTDIVIINYEGLSKWAEFIQMRTWGACIVDEAHLMKNAKTLRSRQIKGWKPKPNEAGEPIEGIKAVRKIRMTGTPIVNRPIELWNLIEDLAPEQFGNFWHFAKRYANANSNGYGYDFNGASNLDELQRRLRETIMVRRLKSEVLTELPRKIRQIIEIEAETADQKRAVRRESAYQSESDDRLAGLRAAVELSKAEGDEAYKAAVDNLKEASMVDFSEMSKLRHETALSKVSAVIAHVQACLEDNTNKILVACHHRDVAEALVKGLAEFHPVLLMGGMKESERDASVTTFQNDPRCRVFVGGIMAAGVGITLTAASHGVFAELDWVPGNVTQMEDRLHRIGQTQTVLIQHIVLGDSLDAHMAKVLVEKQEVIDKALDVNHPDRVQPVYTPKAAAATSETKVSELDKLAAEMTAERIAEVHEKLRFLAGYDLDRASEMNGVGFNKLDTVVGTSLAERASLTPRAAALGAKIVRKYHGQCGRLSWESK